jgi:hypothetical protein
MSTSEFVCPICTQTFLTEDVLVRHASSCDGKITPVAPSNPISLVQADEKSISKARTNQLKDGFINDIQKKALKFVQIKSMVLSNEYKLELLPERLKKLGYNGDADMITTLNYIRNLAPLIIHINLNDTMRFIVKDTHYRNQFETRTSKGTLSSSSRTSWEDRMFNKFYHDASGPERVKYGVLNVTNDPNGVKACYGYGNSYLLVKNDTMRLRTTFASCDTSSQTVKLASCEHYAHVLMEYTDEELRAVVDVALGKKLFAKSDVIGHYKEVQYHGEVIFARDIEALVVNAAHAKDKAMCEMISQFASQNNIQVIFMEGARPVIDVGTVTKKSEPIAIAEPTVVVKKRKAATGSKKAKKSKEKK